MLTMLLAFLALLSVGVFPFMAWTTPRTWVPGELVTANMMNTHVRDNLNALRSEHFPVQQFRGLNLRTKPGENGRVMLVKADEIVMDDGTRLAGWASQEAANGASGAGGIDTGSVVASTWYEIYAIAKDDGTKNLLLHRSKDWFKDEEQAASTTEGELRSAGGANEKFATKFQVDTAGQVPFIDLQILKEGAPTGSIWLTIEADSAGNPSGTPLTTSEDVDVSIVSTSAQWIRFVFRTPVSLTALTDYHIVLQGDYTASDTANIHWRIQGGGSVYARGDVNIWASGAWTHTTTQDFTFKIYVTRNETAVTMPATYTKKALIGYTYNDAGNNLVKFSQLDRHVQINWPVLVSVAAVTIATLIDCSAAFPPVPVALTGLYGTSSVADDRWVITGVPDGYGGDNGFSRALLLTSAASGYVNPGILLTDFQGVYWLRSSGTGNLTLFLNSWVW